MPFGKSRCRRRNSFARRDLSRRHSVQGPRLFPGEQRRKRVAIIKLVSVVSGPITAPQNAPSPVFGPDKASRVNASGKIDLELTCKSPAR